MHTWTTCSFVTVTLLLHGYPLYKYAYPRYILVQRGQINSFRRPAGRLNGGGYEGGSPLKNKKKLYIDIYTHNTIICKWAGGPGP